MKFYEFDRKHYPHYAVIYANSEGTALNLYNNQYDTKNYYVPRPLDIDELFDIILEAKKVPKLASYDQFQLYSYFNTLIKNCVGSKTSKIVL